MKNKRFENNNMVDLIKQYTEWLQLNNDIEIIDIFYTTDSSKFNDLELNILYSGGELWD